MSHNYTPIRNVETGEDVEASTTITTDASKSNSRLLGFLGIVSIAVVSFFAIIYVNSGSNTFAEETAKSTPFFDAQGRFVMKNYDTMKPMSDFLNGLGGLWGVPMWAFYVNRGQALSSFGRQNKDGSIEKFVTAERAYQQTPYTGFRTFIKGSRGGKSFTHMPFAPRDVADGEIDEISRNLSIGENEIEIEEVEPTLNLQTNVVYFTPTDEEYPSLIRRTTFTNLDPSQPLQIEVLDGLARLIPAGLHLAELDAMGRTLEAYMKVYNVKKDGTPIKEPYFHITQGTGDTAQVTLVNDGQFMVAFIDDEDEVSATTTGTPSNSAENTDKTNIRKGDTEPTLESRHTSPDGLHPLLGLIVDPSVVFGTDTTLTYPKAFFRKDAPNMNTFLTQPQGTVARTPCTFAGAKLLIPGGKKVTITSVYGHSESLESFLTNISPRVRVPGYAARKRVEARTLVEDITSAVTTTTSSRIFNEYIQQDYLDNVLRGGKPLVLGDPADPKIFHTFSRIHGDIERDYNNFQIDTTYFSQGPGNFRDVSQNRRMDVLLQPAVKDFNIRMFLSLVQADGYNPLTVASTLFKVPEKNLDALILTLKAQNVANDGKAAAAVKAVLLKPFRPGQFFLDISKAGVTFGIPRDDVLTKIVSAAEQHFAANFAQNGFWADHWTYTLDLVTNYLAVYPDLEERLLWDSEPVPFFLSPAYILPRSERYSIVDNPQKPGSAVVRAYRAVSIWGEPDFDVKLNNELLAIQNSPTFVTDVYGASNRWMRDAKGNTFRVPIVTKLFMLGAIKFSSLDPFGMGVEMEGGKPGWNDAMNGLPGIMGSGMSETYEMYEILKFVNRAVQTHKRGLTLPTEFATFLTNMRAALDVFATSDKSPQAEFVYWDASNNARETYRHDTRVRFSGETVKLAAADVTSVLAAMQAKTQAGIAKALATNNGYSPTYFYFECTNFTLMAPTAVTVPATAGVVVPNSFVLHSLPLFLEGPMRHMKTLTTEKERREVYQRTHDSVLYDTALQMYTVSASLASIGPDVGRMVAFSPGWLENESVWLHMSYKFYLGLLRGGLYEEFFTEISTGLVPFMDPNVYGRSPLEATSFIVSSAFPDAKLHGQGFLARLSGSTAEFLAMWSLMTVGPAPFSLSHAGELQLSFKPVIPGWMFPEDGKLTFTFLGAVSVTLFNPTRVDSWKISPVGGELVYTDGTVFTSTDGTFGKAQALDVRALKVQSIVIQF